MVKQIRLHVCHRERHCPISLLVGKIRTIRNPKKWKNDIVMSNVDQITNPILNQLKIIIPLTLVQIIRAIIQWITITWITLFTMIRCFLNKGPLMKHSTLMKTELIQLIVKDVILYRQGKTLLFLICESCRGWIERFVSIKMFLKKSSHSLEAIYLQAFLNEIFKFLSIKKKLTKFYRISQFLV